MSPPPCPCGSGTAYDACCGPFIAGAPAPTAEALMRSRYTAFVRRDADYIAATYAAEHRHTVGTALEPADWAGLEILGKTGGGPGDLTGTVAFAARYRQDGALREHRENSNFRREDGRWVYIDGVIAPSAPPAKPGRTGRNDPCPCGSGRKFKKCCGG